jgi:hypothetical protein
MLRGFYATWIHYMAASSAAQGDAASSPLFWQQLFKAVTYDRMITYHDELSYMISSLPDWCIVPVVEHQVCVWLYAELVDTILGVQAAASAISSARPAEEHKLHVMGPIPTTICSAMDTVWHSLYHLPCC